MEVKWYIYNLILAALLPSDRCVAFSCCATSFGVGTSFLSEV
ncbi:hypothetical protein [Nostoc sp.]